MPKLSLPSLCATFALAGNMAFANEWIQWEWVTPLPQGRELRSVATGPDATVMVGTAGTVVRLVGDSFEVINVGESAWFTDVVWAGNAFVAIGFEGTVFTSSNGKNWTKEVFLPSSSYSSLNALSWDGERLVAIGTSAFISTNGEDWAEHDIGGFVMEDLATGGGRYVALGIRGVVGGQRLMLTSADGETWVEVDLSNIDAEFGFSSIVWFDGEFVAMGGNFEGDVFVLTSTDGLNWTLTDHNFPFWLDRAVVADGRIAGLGPGGFASSSDTISWTVTEVPWPYISGLGWTGSDFLLVGGGGSILQGDHRGGFEDQRTTSLDLFLYDVVMGGPGVVGAGYGGTAFSLDGREWIENTEFPASTVLTAVTWGQEAYWAVGSHGEIFTSDDGRSWKMSFLDADLVFEGVVATQDTVVAIGYRYLDVGVGPVVVTKTNGDSWEVQFPEPPFPLLLSAVIHHKGMFVVTGYGGYAFSADGYQWDVGTSGSPFVQHLASNGELIVGVGAGELATSRYGYVWDVVDIPGGRFSDVTWTGSLWVAQDRWYIYTSRDGLTWNTERTSFGTSATSILGSGPNLLIAAGAQILFAKHVSALPRRPGNRVTPDAVEPAYPPETTIGEVRRKLGFSTVSEK